MEFTTVNVEARKNLDMRPGDTVRVGQKIQEKGKTRIQNFEGIVLARKHGAEQGATFTVRRVVNGMGVEKVFPLFAPMIDTIEIVKRGKTRRSKLYYIRNKAAKEISKRMRMIMMSVGLADEEAKTAPAVEEETTDEAPVEDVSAEAAQAETPEEAPAEEVKDEVVEGAPIETGKVEEESTEEKTEESK